MADWSTLKPLRVHLVFMTIVVLVLASVLFFTPRGVFKSQNKNLDKEIYDKNLSVKALNGLSIRNKPSIKGLLVATAPLHAKLSILDDNAALDNIGGIHGKWYKVEYNGIIGYAWGNYIGNVSIP